jgi:hypothetical protein
METITAQTLSMVAHELIAHQSIEWMMDHLEVHQPELLNYVMLALDNFTTEAGMKATQLTWFAFRGFELQSTKPIARLSREFILRRESQNQGLADAGGNISLNAFVEIMSLETAAQPYLMEFVRRSVAVPLAGSGKIDESVIKECVAIYLTVKTAIDSLDAATN